MYRQFVEEKTGKYLQELNQLDQQENDSVSEI